MTTFTSEMLDYEYNIIVAHNVVTIVAFCDWVVSLDVIEEVLITANYVIGTNDQNVALRLYAVVGILEVACGMTLIHNLGALGLIQAYAQNEDCVLKIIK